MFVKMETHEKESTVILEYILRRIRKGLGVNALIIGPPGIGKSYVCLRIGESIHNALFNEKFDVKTHVVYDLPSAFRFVRNVTRKGEVLVIEEVSVIASARRSMATENVTLNYLLDTVRKKQVILLLNGPHIKAIDKHIQRMSHMLIECLRINKKEKLTTIKAFTLTNSQDTGKVYKHRFRFGTREVHRSFFYIPSKEIREDYEVIKSEFMEGLYKRMEEKNEKKMGRENKELPALKRFSMPTENQLAGYKAYLKYKNYDKAAESLNVSHTTIRNRVNAVLRKMKINLKEEKPLNINIKNLTE